MPKYVVEFDDSKRDELAVQADYMVVEGRWLQFKSKDHAIVATVPDWNVLTVRGA